MQDSIKAHRLADQSATEHLIGHWRKEGHDWFMAETRVSARQEETKCRYSGQLVAGGDSTAGFSVWPHSSSLVTIVSLESYCRAWRSRALRAKSPAYFKRGSRCSFHTQAVVKKACEDDSFQVSLLLKQAPPEGDVFDGKWISGGTRIAHSPMEPTAAPIYAWSRSLPPERLARSQPWSPSMMEKQLDHIFWDW